MTDNASWLQEQWQRHLAERQVPTADPRPDLHTDHVAWSALLSRAHGVGPSDLFWALQGLRCCGASLTRIDGHLRLGRGQMPQAEYDSARSRYLLPHAEVLKGLVEATEVKAERKGL